MLPNLTRSDVFRLETSRLWLRWPEPRDAAVITGFVACKEVATMTATWPHPLPDGEVPRRIERMRQRNEAGLGLVLALCTKVAQRRVVGLIGGRPDHDAPEAFGVGYLLAPDHWGQGLMTEALTVYREAAFRLTRVRRMTAVARTIDQSSRHVLENVGFRHVETKTMDMAARGPGIAVDCFALERERVLRRQKP